MSIPSDFSVVSFPWGRTPPQLADILAIARRAEELGFYSVNRPLPASRARGLPHHARADGRLRREGRAAARVVAW